MKHLLLLHGAIGSENQLEPLAKKLKHSFEIHSINFSGHGGEKMPEKFSIEIFANDVLNYLEKNKIEKINIFGYSMGGYVALYLAKYYPDKIDKVFTLATKFSWTLEIAMKETKMLDAEKISEKLPAFANILAQRHFPNDWKTVLNKTSEMMIEMGKDNPVKLSHYSNIENHVMVGIGDKDSMVTLEETIEAYRQLKKGGLIVLPETRHPIEKVNVDRLSHEIEYFFDS